jgi:hypothetical protein
VDPSTGVIMAQGHFVFHFAYAIIIQFFVTYVDDDSFSCMKYDEDSETYVLEEKSHPEINYVVNAVKYIHLICFFAMIFAENNVPSKITTS